MTVMAMNPDVKAQWLAALRSGEYGQGTSYLRRNEEFCCLGVLCEIAVKNGIIPEATASGKSGAYVYGSGQPSCDDGCTGECDADSSQTVLPLSVMKWAGLDSVDGKRGSGPADLRRQALTGVNDEGASFAEIADIIEAEF